ncbi:MAG: hypothetical protein PUD92_08810 [Clostridiales bacterium]|nr:hypothetical protein [Clostridiales bacterium]
MAEIDEKEQKIQDAIKLLNDNKYLVIPVTNGQLCLCNACCEPETDCRYGAFGYTCSNLICINNYVKEQINYKDIIANIKTE